MAEVTLYNQKGESVGKLDLPAGLFEVEANPALVHEVVVAQEANARTPVAHTKGRGDVRGGGRKPWKQKGTGRARHGSRRSPIWVGGGITFGPSKERNFSKKVNKKAKKKVLAMVLSDKVAQNHFVAVDSLEIPEGKTKTLADVLSKLPNAGKKTLVVLEDARIDAARAARNLPKTTTISAKSLNPVDLLNHEFVLASKDAIDVINETYKRA